MRETGVRATLFDLPVWAVPPLFLVVLAGSAYPIFAHEIISINDLLNHLTRGWVILNYEETPAFQQYFIVNWGMLPNLAIDLFVNVAARFVPLAVAGKLFILTVLTLILSGAVFLHRVVFGKWSVWPFLVAILLYCRPLLDGITNYLFGIGVFLHAVALWIWMRDKPVVPRLAVACVLALVVFFAHLFALGVLGLTILGYELARLAEERPPFRSALRDLVVAGIPFIPPFLIFVLLTPHTGASFVIAYRDVAMRLRAFGAPILYDAVFDVAVFLSLGAVTLWLAAVGTLRVDRRLAVPIVLLFIAQLMMPNVLMTAEGVDHRIPIVLALLAVCATDVSTNRRAAQAVFATVAAAALLARLWMVDAVWTAGDAVYADARAALAAIPPGAKVATALPETCFDNSGTAAVAVYYLPIWEVVRRGGFTQTLFTFPTQQPLVLQPAYRELAAASPPDRLWDDFVLPPDGRAGAAEPDPRRMAALRRYDYIAFVHNAPFTVRPTPLLEPVHVGEYTQVYRVRKPSG